MDFDLSTEQKAVRDLCRDFAREVVAPAAEDLDRHHKFGYDIVRQMGELGLFGLPFGEEQVVECARDHFRVVSSQSGRLDYIETIKQWDKRTEAWTPRLALLKLQLIPKWLTSPDFRFAFTSGVSSNSACFERELMDHYRLVFEKL